jgi:hypothetical protein
MEAVRKIEASESHSAAPFIVRIRASLRESDKKNDLPKEEKRCATKERLMCF